MSSNNSPPKGGEGSAGDVPRSAASFASAEPTNRRELSAYLTGSAVLFAAYFYFIAWIHLYFYYRELGISLMSLDIPIYYFIVYAYSAIDRSSIDTYLLVLAAVFAFSILDRSWSVDRIPFVDIAHRVLLTGFLLLLFIFGYALARTQGLRQANDARLGKILYPVHLAFKDVSRSPVFAEIIVADRNFELSLITETKDNVYILREPTAKSAVSPIAFTYTLARKDLSYIKVDLLSEGYSDSQLCGIPPVCDLIRFITEPTNEKGFVAR
ncbi:hypothetical protein QFZ99_006103 [Paraburkholderia atlantica]|uniref:hypothetical protein n=1 Tax=Paraburkholderia atlantica TaxID=2654982 RepID=UPI003D1EBC6F